MNEKKEFRGKNNGKQVDLQVNDTKQEKQNTI